MADHALNTAKQIHSLAQSATGGHVPAQRRVTLGELPEFRYHYPGIICVRDFTLKQSSACKHL